MSDAMPDCLICGVQVENLAHPAAPLRPGDDVDYACEPCYSRLMEMVVRKPDPELLRCGGCGAAFGAGCSCRDNGRAIGRGEAAKCRAEEPWSR
jgi:hypothetical protein